MRLVGRRSVGGGNAGGGNWWRFIPALGLIGVVASGCAGAMGPGAPPAAPSRPTPARDAYRDDIEALAREARALFAEADGERIGEVAGCEVGAEGAYDGALYDPTEPLSSMIQQVSKAEEELEKKFNDEQIQCYRRCVNNPNPPNGFEKGEARHRQYCQSKCLKEFMEKMKKAGLVKEFSALDAAKEWLKSHTKEVTIGTLVVVGAVVYVVMTGTGGAVVLAVLSAG